MLFSHLLRRPILVTVSLSIVLAAALWLFLRDEAVYIAHFERNAAPSSPGCTKSP